MDETAVICRGCEFILDTEFLGADILDEEQALRPGAGGVDPAAFNLADAVILGNIDESSHGVETMDSGFHHLKGNFSARLYVSGQSQALMAPDAVPALAESIEGVRLTPFERHVLAFIDGKRPVESIRRAAGLDEAEVKTALATLSDKGVVKVVGRLLADLAAPDDPDSGAARRAPRARGVGVGAVALVGDVADRVIEDAFRTQVRAMAPALSGDGADGPAGGLSGRRNADLPSDVDADVLSRLRAAGEIESEPTLRARPAKPAAAKASGGSPTRARAPGAPKANALASADDPSSDVVPERAFDEFDKLEPATDAARGSGARRASQSSAPSLADPLDAPRSGVFAEVSDLSKISRLHGLADSQVVRRPGGDPGVFGSRLSTPARHDAAAVRATHDHGGSDLHHDGSGSDSAEAVGAIDRVAAAPPSSELWSSNDETPALASALQLDRPAAVAIDDSSSVSLTALLEATDNEPTGVGHRQVSHRGGLLPRATLPALPGVASGASAAVFVEDTTAANQPMPARPPAELAQRLTHALARVPGQSPDAGPAASSEAWEGIGVRGASLADPAAASSGALDEHSGLHKLSGQTRVRSSAADEIFDETSSALNPPHVGDAVKPDPARSMAAGSAEFPSGRRPLDVSHSGAAEASGDARRLQGASAGRGPSEELVDSSLLIRPAGLEVAVRSAVTHGGQHDSKGAAEPERARGRCDEAPAPRSGLQTLPPEAAQEPSDGAENALDPEATVTLDAEAQKRRFRREPPGLRTPAARAGAAVATGSSGGAAPLSPGLQRASGLAESSTRPRVNDENRRKARKLFDEAHKEALAGRIGAARINTRLASLYDPENEDYKRQLAAWDGGGTAPGNAAQVVAGRAGQIQGAEDESLADVKALYDEAQRFEDQGDVDGALDLLAQGIDRFPNAAAFHNRVGVILALRKRDFMQAAQAVQRAVDLDPSNLHYKSNLSKIIAKLQRGAS